MLKTEKKYLSRINDFGEVLERQHSFYGSSFVRAMIENGGRFVSDRTGVTYRIPSHFGFCYGVEKSIDMAFETVKRFPDRRIFLTHDVIHNPKVNHDLAERDVTVLDRDAGGELLLDGIRPEDIVVISAFGSKHRDVAALKTRDCIVVDTTCGAIVMVWKRVERYAKHGYTAVIHGIWDHEETQATASQSAKLGGHFVIIRNMEEARLIEEFLKKRIDAAGFRRRLAGKCSEGFDPETMLRKIGIASQTTMLKDETLKIQEYLRGVYEELHGAEAIAGHFMKYDTICSATQERQDALFDLLEEPHDLMVIIGGFNSSNTTHLSEIASEKFSTVHIEGPGDLREDGTVRRLDPSSLRILESRDWLPPSVRSVGISSGASTPDLSIEKTVLRLEDLLAAR